MSQLIAFFGIDSSAGYAQRGRSAAPRELQAQISPNEAEQAQDENF